MRIMLIGLGFCWYRQKGAHLKKFKSLCFKAYFVPYSRFKRNKKQEQRKKVKVF